MRIFISATREGSSIVKKCGASTSVVQGGGMRRKKCSTALALTAL